MLLFWQNNEIFRPSVEIWHSANRDVRNGYFKFCSVSVWENHGFFGFGFEKKRRFVLLCRSVAKNEKNV